MSFGRLLKIVKLVRVFGVGGEVVEDIVEE